MFSDILIPVDPDDEESEVVAYGMELANTFDATVHVLAVTEGPQERDQLRTDAESTAREYLDELVETYDRPAAAKHVRPGTASEEILGAIEELGIDLVVMGTHARDGVEKMLLGSVAESVIESSPVPVMTVPPRAELTSPT